MNETACVLHEALFDPLAHYNSFVTMWRRALTQEVARSIRGDAVDVSSSDSAAWLLRSAGYRHAATVLERLAQVADRASIAFDAAYQEAGLTTVESFLRGLRDDGRLSDERVSDIRALWSEVQQTVERMASVSVVNEDIDLARILTGLHLFGVINRRTDGGVSYFLHPESCAINLHRLVTFNQRSCITHVMQMSKIRGVPLTKQQAAERYNYHIRELQGTLKATLESQVRELLAPSQDFQVELLPTSADWYAAGVSHYRRRYRTRRLYTIFSTTPGIMLPEERFGQSILDNLQDDNPSEPRHDEPVLERYFQALWATSSNKPRLYNFELDRAQKQYRATICSLGAIERQRYEEHAMRLLKPLLHDPNFGLVRFPRFPPDFDYLTLGNGASVLISGRKEGRIYRGLWVRPERNDILMEAVREIDLGDALKSGLATLTGYVLAEQTTSGPLPDLAQIALTMFYAPLAYMLIRGTRWRPRTAAATFEDLTDRLRAQVPLRDSQEIKRIGMERPLVRVESLEDLLV